MTDDTATEGGMLVRVEVMTAEFVAGHTTNRVNEVGAVQIFEPILIRVVGVGTTIEVVGRRVLPTFLVTCIL